VKVIAEAADNMRHPAEGLVVLLYHRIGAGTAVSVDLPLAMFDEQMAELAVGGRAITLDQAVAGLLSNEPLAGNVVVTFDDGTADFVDNAVPVLARHGVPATLFVATEFVETGRWFPDRGRPTSWSALADALTTGLVAVGSHTHTHSLLDRLDRGRVADELDRSIDLIEDHLGRSADHFAYPKALAPSPAADAAVRRRFRSAALAGTRANPVGSDVYRLARSPIQRTDRRRWFEQKLAGGMRLEDDLRGLIDRRRHVGASV
jgi:peptidoglycan/xylan/chitin deacetylase (PgdA/CDA1 family)